jgi:hypothetical protein
MTKLTITEALQEVKTINARIVKKQESIGNYLARDSRVRDPLEKGGGSEKFISGERQSIADLRTRLINIRSSIQRTNLSSEMTLQGTARSVADWLTWRREVAGGEQTFVTSMLAGIRKIRNEVQKLGGTVGRTTMVESLEKSDPPQIVVNADETALMKEQEKIETLLGELDGKLSLFNAVTFIEV